MESDPQDDEQSTASRALRGAVIFFLLLGTALAFMPVLVFAAGEYNPLLVSLSILIGLPFCIGALGQLLFKVFRVTTRSDVASWVIAIVLLVFVSGALVLREAIICILMAAPFWLLCGWLGISAMDLAIQRNPERPRINGAAFLMVPYAMLGSELYLRPSPQTYTVSRSVVIDAVPQDVRPLLNEMRDISPSEGRWNITQDLFGVPRPVSAIVDDGVRQARWENNVSFEERLEFSSGMEMRWRFAFPNDSVSRHSDRHISPDSEHLKIETGGYRMEPLSDGRVRLTLNTRYTARTPINAYAALWGELILGDIQSNVLAIIRDRAEASHRSD